MNYNQLNESDKDRNYFSHCFSTKKHVNHYVRNRSVFQWKTC